MPTVVAVVSGLANGYQKVLCVKPQNFRTKPRLRVKTKIRVRVSLSPIKKN
jgi:hypothetical protein